MNLICKLFNFLLALFVNVVEGVAYALKTVGGVLLDLLSSTLDSVGDLIGVGGGTLALIGAGLLFLFLLNKGGDDEQRNGQRVSDQQAISRE